MINRRLEINTSQALAFLLDQRDSDHKPISVGYVVGIEYEYVLEQAESATFVIETPKSLQNA
jgi:hypothetical protein